MRFESKLLTLLMQVNKLQWRLWRFQRIRWKLCPLETRCWSRRCLSCWRNTAASSVIGDLTPSLLSATTRGRLLKFISLVVLVSRVGLFNLNWFFGQESPEGASEEGWARSRLCPEKAEAQRQRNSTGEGGPTLSIELGKWYLITCVLLLDLTT